MNARTDYQYDALGRVTQTLGPAHSMVVWQNNAYENGNRPVGHMDLLRRHTASNVDSPGICHAEQYQPVDRFHHSRRAHDHQDRQRRPSDRPNPSHVLKGSGADYSVSDLQSGLTAYLNRGLNPFQQPSFVTWTTFNMPTLVWSRRGCTTTFPVQASGPGHGQLYRNRLWLRKQLPGQFGWRLRVRCAQLQGQAEQVE